MKIDQGEKLTKAKDKTVTGSRSVKNPTRKTARGTSDGGPRTMEELLVLEKDKIHGLKKGQMVEGRVTEITGR